MVGVVEALSHTGAPCPRDSVRVLSLGTGTVLNGILSDALAQLRTWLPGPV